jgi:dienelactone hydrolase/alkylhydroperoxidase family enzyme
VSTPQPFTRHDVSFTSGEDSCAAWLYMPTGVTSPPVVILGHGLGGTREMRLDAFAERFAQAGIAAVAFTYRHFGDSGGQPRQLLSIKRQLADWDAAIAWVKNQRDVDGTRIAVWGSSFGGGHSITVASRHPELIAAVSQCPFTDGLASALALGPMESLKVLPSVARDVASMVFRRPPAMIPLAGPPGSLALMNAPDALPGYQALLPPDTTFRNEVAARVAPTIATYRPGSCGQEDQVSNPVLRQQHRQCHATGPNPAVRAHRTARGDQTLRRRPFRLLPRTAVRRISTRPGRISHPATPSGESSRVMPGQTDTLGGRLPLADPAALNPAQRGILERMASRIVPWANDAQFQSTAEDGRLIGPFNPALLNPAIAGPFLDLQFAEQLHTSLSARVREVVILAVGAVWRADYELYAHLAVARKTGLSEEAARAVATGGLPDDLSYDETIALRLTRELSTSHRVDESLYRVAENIFGAKGLIDIAFLIGIYHSVCATLTMFAIPAPE